MARRHSRLTSEILEMAEDMRDAGLLDNASHEQITLRHLGPEARLPSPQLSPEEIREVRERARMSQAAFAHRLNLTPGYISQLERGVRRPTGATLVLLRTVQRNGIDVVP